MVLTLLLTYVALAATSIDGGNHTAPDLSRKELLPSANILPSQVSARPH